MACEDRKVDAQDLRLKLQRKSLIQVSPSGRRTLSGLHDLREKLSGTMNMQPINADPPKQKVEAVKPARKSVAVETSEPEPKRTANTAARKKAQQKADASVDGFLLSLGLEKYAITFQAEEVCRVMFSSVYCKFAMFSCFKSLHELKEFSASTVRHEPPSAG
ncbi:hypothetical protein DITRI_Ditri11bG0062700 [Diplodiscus trichospermus]